VAASSDTSTDFTLRRGTLVLGSVVDASHQPVPGVEVSALDSNQNRVATATARDDGSFQLSVTPDTYKFIAVDPQGRYGVAYFGGSTFNSATTVNVEATGAPHVTVVVTGPNRRHAVHR
jgi:hypothetical protein